MSKLAFGARQVTVGRESGIVTERLGPIGGHVPDPAALLNQAAVVAVSRHIRSV